MSTWTPRMDYFLLCKSDDFIINMESLTWMVLIGYIDDSVFLSFDIVHFDYFSDYSSQY